MKYVEPLINVIPLANYGSPVLNGKSRKDVLPSEQKGDFR